MTEPLPSVDELRELAKEGMRSNVENNPEYIVCKALLERLEPLPSVDEVMGLIADYALDGYPIGPVRSAIERLAGQAAELRKLLSWASDYVHDEPDESVGGRIGAGSLAARIRDALAGQAASAEPVQEEELSALLGLAPSDWEKEYERFKDGPAFPPEIPSLKVAFGAGVAWAQKQAAGAEQQPAQSMLDHPAARAAMAGIELARQPPPPVIPEASVRVEPVGYFWKDKYQTWHEDEDQKSGLIPLYASPPPAIQEGFVLVPKVPTVEMKLAGEVHHGCPSAIVYRAMLAAAPQPIAQPDSRG
jgi:hypothetical protein